MATPPLPSPGATSGRNSYVTLAFSGIPNKGDEFRIDYLSLGTHIWDTCEFFPLVDHWGSLRRQGLRSHLAHIWPEPAWVRQPIGMSGFQMGVGGNRAPKI